MTTPETKEKPRVSIFTKLSKTKSWFSLVVGSVITITVLVFQGVQFFNTLATRQQVDEIQNYVIAENLKLKQDIDYLITERDRMSKDLSDTENSFIDHMEKHAGRLAAEREPNRAKAARAAAAARAKFKEAIKEGKTAEQALLNTITYPF